MIEVNLFSVSAGDIDNSVGKCVSRSRMDIDSLGVSILEFVKGFLRDNLDNLESAIKNSDLVSFINSSQAMSTMDFASINYLLKQVGYYVTIWNVAEDEDNKVNIPAGTVEYNIINHNFLQHDYPTVTKLIPSDNQTLGSIISTIVEQCGLFDQDKFAGVRNPFNILTGNLKKEEEKLGNINASIITKIYSLLDQMGVNVYCGTSEE